MPLPDLITKGMKGIRIDRAAAALPQSAQAPLFTVSGGRVLVTALFGEVTTVMGATASNISLIANPTVGADVPLCAVVASANDAVGVLYGPTGLFSDALVKGAAIPDMLKSIIIPAGTIDLLTSGSNTGAAKWRLYYMPYDAGARVIAA